MSNCQWQLPGLSLALSNFIQRHWRSYTLSSENRHCLPGRPGDHHSPSKTLSAQVLGAIQLQAGLIHVVPTASLSLTLPAHCHCPPGKCHSGNGHRGSGKKVSVVVASAGNYHSWTHATLTFGTIRTPKRHIYNVNIDFLQILIS